MRKAEGSRIGFLMVWQVMRTVEQIQNDPNRSNPNLSGALGTQVSSL